MWFYALLGFGACFTGRTTYLMGDMRTYIAFKPLWPFRDTEISLGLVSAVNQEANNAMVILGILCLALYATI
jgi:membrane-bound metal-dependent hydrolase YbcI (DUF457 family)